MSTRSISRRYARALFELEQEGGEISPSLARAARVVGVNEILNLLAMPQVPPVTKAEVIDKATGSLSKEVRRLVEILCARDKAELLPEIAGMVEEMRRQAASEAEAEVISVIKLDAEMKKKITAALGKAAGRKVKLNVRRDPGILGGLIIRIGDRQMDYSLRTRLQGLRRAMLS